MATKRKLKRPAVSVDSVDRAGFRQRDEQKRSCVGDFDDLHSQHSPRDGDFDRIADFRPQEPLRDWAAGEDLHDLAVVVLLARSDQLDD